MLQLPKSRVVTVVAGPKRVCTGIIIWLFRLGTLQKFGHMQNITRTDFVPLGLSSYFIVIFFSQNVLCLLPCSIFLLQLARGFWVDTARMTGTCV